MTSGSQAEAPVATRPWWRIPARVLMVLLAATIIGWALHHISAVLERDPRPAGFVRGVLQGALMPMSVPNLLVGNDLTIYAQSNTGLTYKLGYASGVNACGALFFGLFYWRVIRWRKSWRREG